MTRLVDIRGQERAIDKLQRAIESGRVAHAYLFCGPSGCGKYSTALALARALDCLVAPGQGCFIADDGDSDDACAACSRIAGGIHPDVQTLQRQGAARIIPIATIRDEVIPQLALPPHEARARFFLIEEATSLQDAAANALLKTLEEPPPRTHFVLCTTAPENLLPTIRSRCQRIAFAALPAELRARLHADDEAAGKLDELVSALRAAIAGIDSDSLHDAAKEVAGERVHVDPALELLSQSLHRDARQAAFDNRLTHAAALARQAMLVLDTRQALTQNAHAQTALEALLHTLRMAPT